MTSRVKRHSAFLLLLHVSQPMQRKVLIETATNDQLHALFMVMHNILYGILPLPKNYIKTLAKHESHFLQIIDKKVSLKQRKQTLLRYQNQVGKLMKAFASITEWREK
jgi:hypothetical protein